MRVETQEYLEVIANRQAPGDSWVLVGDKIVHKSLTEALEAWFQKTGEKAEFRLAPLDSKLYVIRNKEVEIKPPPIKSYSLYGDRD